MNIKPNQMQSKNISEQIKNHFKHQQWFETDFQFLMLPVRIISNNTVVLQSLKKYFSEYISPRADTPVTQIYVFEEEDSTPLPYDWQDWAREPGKTGRKDAFVECEQGRVILKVRTGMQFLQSQQHKIAWGAVANNLNQVINFINNQYMNHLQAEDWLISHASACLLNQQALAFAGYSGGGKSTIMLHLMNQYGAKFISNDRLFISPGQSAVKVAGIPKLPRVNPGTLMNNPALSKMLDTEQLNKYAELAETDLWQLEEKHDVNIKNVFGDNKVVLEGPLGALYILNWSHKSKQATQINAISLHQKPHLLKAVMKSPGPFYQDNLGDFIDDTFTPQAEDYLARLANTKVYEVTGKADFQVLSRFCAQEL
ncbi:HprK-related kinase B [Gayadomonas joobiniege]|uniref:HprK-related kinase B n=1 Tax=Gayadomonas joobiniege TaxID=1234606 RepID=UPI000381F0FD|nr:HprK-related kinase B [Gayadomonas joobiniege]